MMFWRQLGLSDAAAGVLAVLILIFGGGAWLAIQGSAPLEDEAAQVVEIAPEPVVENPAPEDVPDIAEKAAEKVAEPKKDAPDPEIVVDAAPEPDVEVTPVPAAPQLDLVRVSPEGDAVVAGTADPGAMVVFLVNGVELARADADSSGAFVGLFEIPASDAPNSITVAAEGADGALFSDETVLIAAITPELPEDVTTEDVAVAEVPEVEAEAPIEDIVAEVAPEVTEETAETTELALLADTTDDAETEAEPEPVTESKPVVEPNTVVKPQTERIIVVRPDQKPVDVQDDVAAMTAPETQERVAAVAPEISAIEPARAAPTIVVAGRDGVKVVQPAQQPNAPKLSDSVNVVIDTITYDTQGEVALVGRGQGDGFVRIYLDDKPVLTVPVEPDGSWTTPLADVDAGVYRLRVDEISAEGTVTSRVETPFQREEVAIAADAPPTAVTVQPGSTLWAIARDRFGDGVEYVRVYEANRDLIRDPDLIYPGQVFALPTE